MSRRPCFVDAVVVFAALFWVGVAGPALAQNTVKIGVLTPLSPPGDAAAGQFIVRGAKMAADGVNGRGGILGGRKVDLVIEDDSGTPEKGVAGFRKLATQDRVAAVIGQFHSSVMAAVQDLAEQFKIPVFATQASAKSITERHLIYTFRTHVIDTDRVAFWNRWIKHQAYKRVAFLGENTDYGIGLAEDTKKLFKTMDVAAELKTIIFDRAVVDLTPQLLEIKSWKPDLVINAGVGTPVYLIIKQAYDIGLFPSAAMLVSYDLPARPEFWKNLGEKGASVAFIVYYHPTMKLTPRGEAFRTKYREQFKEDPVYGALNAYAQISLVADAVNAAKSDSGEQVARALVSNKFEGWNGTISFTRGEGPYWQQWTPPMLLMQYAKVEMPFTEAPIVFPPELRTGDFTPAPKR
jgi:branched-chain amino acid transport system substrate-binding protein